MNARVRVASLFVLLAGAVLTAGQGQTQSPPQEPLLQGPTFKAEVEYVEVDAVVTDEKGQLVQGLTKDDFQVSEDGKPQTISAFSVVNIPIEQLQRPLFADRAIEPDVVSNERPFDGRVYVMILDDLHVDALRSQRVKQSAREFIERNMGVNDLMAVVFTGGRADAAQEFTNNKRLLLRAVDQFIGRKLPSPTISRNEQFFRQADAGITDQRVPDQYEVERGYNAQSMLRSLRQVADWFGGVRGRRKTIMLFSEGIDYDLTDIIRTIDQPTNVASSLITDIRDTIAATARSNVSIYALDPRGLTTLGDDTIGVSSFADSVDSGSGIGLRGLRNELWMSQQSLRTLAEESGGFAAVNRNDTSNVLDRIVRDNSTYYVLAYYPPNKKADGKFHRIDVKVNRPGLTVRARRGYSTPRNRPTRNTRSGGMPPEMFEAINSPLPVSGGLAMRVFTAPFKGPQPNASVLVGVEMGGRGLSLAANSKVDISLMAVDNKAKVHGARNDALSLNLRPETKARIEQTGLRVLNRLNLPPGRYQLRVAARDSVNTALGSVIYDLEVPDFYKQTFSVSGLAMTSMSGSAMMTAQPDEQLKSVLPAAPIGLRTFPQNDEIALFAEVYDNSGKAPHKVDIVTSVLTDEGKVLFKTEDERDSSELQGAKGGYGYTTRIPLSDVPPGLYVLSVEARSRLGTDIAATRQVQFRVVPAVRGPQQ
jgi:VWFA-related protein